MVFRLFCLLLLAFSPREFKIAAGSKTLIVPIEFPTIQAAINNAADGDAVFVYNGTYQENLVLNKSITLIGEDEAITIVDGGGVGTVIYVWANNVSIINFTIRNSGFSTPMSGIFVASNYVKVKENTVANNYFGIYLKNSRGNVVCNCTILDNQIGVYLESSVDNVLESNNVTGNHDTSVYLHYSSNNIVQRNTISGNGNYGIHLQHSNINNLEGNFVTGHQNGVFLDISGNNTLSTNSMTLNRYNFGVSGDSLSDFIQNADTSNTVNGKLVYYLVDQKDLSINSSTNPEVGYLAIINSTNVTAKDLNLTENEEGILLAYTTGAMVKNCVMANNSRGALLYQSGYSNLSSNVVVHNLEGISLSSSGDAVVNGNVVAENDGSGIELESSGRTMLAQNNVTLNAEGGVYLYSSEGCDLNENLVVNNSLGFRLQFSGNSRMARNVIANNSGEGIYLTYCNNCIIEDNNISGNLGYGVHQSSCDLNVIAGNTLISNRFSGLYLYESQFNLVEHNIVRSNDIGVYLYYSSNNSLCSNNATDNFGVGVCLRFCHGSYISSNLISDNIDYGLYVYSSNQTRIVGNGVINNSQGLRFVAIYDSIVCGNEIAENRYSGIYLSYSKGNKIFHNLFLNNTINVQVLDMSISIWDDGYPSGGNFWSDYHGEDLYGGPFQNLTGSDGIGDEPYVINHDNRDRYPLMKPIRIHDIMLTDVELYSDIVYVGWMVEVNVSVKNVGDYMERINVTVYYNTTVLETRTVDNLPVDTSVTITFSRNTTGFGYGNYSIRVIAGPVLGENNTDDNVFDSKICVTIPGDVDADGDVDLYDVVKICAVYGLNKGDENFKANLDINGNRKIDLYDVVIACAHYGQRQP